MWCNTRSNNKRPSFPARPPCCRPCDAISTPTQPRPGQLTFLFPSSSSSSSAAAHTFTRSAACRHRVTCIEVMITRGPRVMQSSRCSRQRPVGLLSTVFIVGTRYGKDCVHANDINLPSARRDVPKLSNGVAASHHPKRFWGGNIPILFKIL